MRASVRNGARRERNEAQQFDQVPGDPPAAPTGTGL
jgi:hypothetical protein